MHALTAASNTLTSANWLTSLSTSAHVVMLAMCVGLPVVVHSFHRQAIRTANAQSLILARRWGNAALAVSAASVVSGLVVGIHSRVLWPGLGEQFGEIVNPALVVGEVAALMQVILLAVYRVGTDRFAPRLHAGLLWPVSLAGATSIGCAVALNTWLATAHDAANGNPGPGAMLSPAMWARTGHALAAGVMVASFAVASVHASGLRRGVHLVRNSMAFRTGMGMGSVAALVQAVAGWLSSVFDAGGSSQWVMVDAMFWLMAALGAAFVALGVLFWWGEWTGRSPAASDVLLVGVSWLGAASVTAMVAGWLTSVLGRTPWLVDGVLLSADAVTRRGGTWLGAALLVGVLIVSTWIGTFVGRMKD